MEVTDARGAVAAEEARLVAQIAAGDMGAPMTELYRRYGKSLFRFGVHMLGDHGLAEEMVQECFVKLWRTASRFDATKASAATYLFMIARSVAMDLVKRPSSRPFGQLDDIDVPPLPDDVEQLLNALIIREALDSLRPIHAQVLQLAQNEGLTQSEIATRLGLRLGTVKTRMFYGMAALRSALAERGINGPV